MRVLPVFFLSADSLLPGQTPVQEATLLRGYREDADLNAKLPVLATYLGHQSMEGTQLYLHLTADLFPEIVVRANAEFGDIIPRRIAS